MRIIRSNDDNDDEDQPKKGRGPQDPHGLGGMVAGVPDNQLGDILGDEVAAFLAAAAEAADNPDFPLGQDAPTEQVAPGQTAKPVLRLVTSEDHGGAAADTASAGRVGSRPRLLRAGLGGSLAVLVAVVAASWGQAAVVAVPLVVYGAGWIAYLWWNAALRPPLPQALITVTTALARAIAAVSRGICRTCSSGIARVDRSRARHETRRTATA